MVRHAHSFLVMLLPALFLISVTGCSGKKQTPLDKMNEAFADVRAEVQSVVADPERAAEADKLLAELQGLYAGTSQSVQAHKDDFLELNGDYDASRVDLEAKMELILADLAANQAKVLEISSQLQQVLTEAEREEIDKARSKALQSAINALGAI